MTAARQVAKTLLANDLEGFSREAWRSIGEQSPFIPAKYWTALCEHLAAVSLGKIRRLIINVPPRFGKSTLVSVLWPCWEWARDAAASRWIFCSHACDLALRDSVRRRNLLQSPWYQTFWHESVQLSADQNQKQEYASTHGGVMFSTWVGGATGRGASRIVIDDPHALSDAYSPVELDNAVKYVRQTLFSRLDEPSKGAIVLIMQRLHENDLTGELLNPSCDADTERLEIKERKSDPAPPDYSMFSTANLRARGIQ